MCVPAGPGVCHAARIRVDHSPTRRKPSERRPTRRSNASTADCFSPEPRDQNVSTDHFPIIFFRRRLVAAVICPSPSLFATYGNVPRAGRTMIILLLVGSIVTAARTTARTLASCNRIIPMCYVNI